LAAAKNADEARTCGAVLASVWVDFEAVIGEGALDTQEDMQEMVLEGENGSIVIASIGVFALCVQGTAPLGKLIATLQRAKKVLYEPLTSIQAEHAD
jgi:predicted regulator of Ras-like GTPase activity (Roadblock/LC7/MglB family)